MRPNLSALPPSSFRHGKREQSFGKNFAVAFSVAIWLLACGLSFAVLADYSNRPGRSGAPLPGWPRESLLELAADRPTLVLIAHPRCPCTRATLGELERLMAQSAVHPRIYVLFVQPAGTPDGWVETDLWKRVSSFPGVVVRRDTNGIEARRFNAATSGEVLLYDKTGRLEFHGGITIARGHEGDNDGRSTIVALLAGASSKQNVTPVFGCPLFSERSQTENGLCKR